MQILKNAKQRYREELILNLAWISKNKIGKRKIKYLER